LILFHELLEMYNIIGSKTSFEKPSRLINFIGRTSPTKILYNKVLRPYTIARIDQSCLHMSELPTRPV